MRDPIIVVSLPRSGSSMVAGAFARHGVWCGTCAPPNNGNPRGYYENQPIATLIGRTSGHRVHKGRLAPELTGWREKVEAVVRGDGYTDGPWLWKGSAVYAPLWHEFDPTWVVVRRDLGAITRSGASSGRYRANERSVRAHLEEMDRLVRDCGASEVDSDAVVGGDFATLEQALELAGLEPDREVLTEWIDPTLWRFGG